MPETKKKITLCIGLPGAGKTTYIDTLTDTTVVSADLLKLGIEGYDPLNPQLVHERSVQLARELVLGFIQTGEPDILLDGGGVNNKYNLSIIRAAKAADYDVQILYFDTPVTVCLERNRRRDRRVPEQSIMSKALDVKRCLVEQTIASGRFWKTIEWCPEYIFLDMDGVLVEYQTFIEIEETRTDYSKHNIFEYADPVTPVLKALKLLPIEKILLTASPGLSCTNQKLRWIENNAEGLNIERAIIVNSSSMKLKNLLHFLESNDIDKTKCMVIDDEHSILWNMNREGIYAIHPSAFLAMVESKMNNIKLISKLVQPMGLSQTFLF